MLPRTYRLTLTGADTLADIPSIAKLAKKWPRVEWAFLYSLADGRMGKPRYPFVSTIVDYLSALKDFPVAIHVCGRRAKAVVLGVDYELGIEVDTVSSTMYRHMEGALSHRAHQTRIQLNGTMLPEEIGRATGLFRWHGIITQTRTASARTLAIPHHALLVDSSGGRGILPDAWNAPYGWRGPLGYAGGLTPENIATEMRRMPQRPGGFWVDLETGLRDETDRFDLDRVERTILAVEEVLKERGESLKTRLGY